MILLQAPEVSATITFVPLASPPILVPLALFLTFNPILAFTYLVYVAVVTGCVLFTVTFPSCE